MNRTDILTHLRAIHKCYEVCLSQVRQAYGLTQFEVDVLAFLRNNPSYNTANHIVEYRLLPKANVSKAIDTLLRRGYLTAERDTADRRRVLLFLTEAAVAATDEILRAQDSFYQLLMADFSPEEQTFYQTLLTRITENALTGAERN
ncbi:MAG: MarR family transcriptional regulator [Lachnospiraceae bacterium]|nr:MarR family transcriptional regulator [Lachnospiraceae bacterium]